MAADGAGESVVVGRFNGSWGVQGWAQVFSFTEPPAAIFDYQPWLVGDERRELAVEEWQQSGPRLVARLAGIDAPEQAAGLRQSLIRVPRAALPRPPEGRYYWHDLIGLEVINRQEHVYGRIRAMLPTGAHDVMEIAAGADDEPVLIPFVPGQFVERVDLAAGTVVVDWPLEWTE